MTTPHGRRPNVDLPDIDDAPWATGRPQPAIRGLADAGMLHGHLLDLGCGTGENALLAAEAGARVVGVDIDDAALAAAASTADARGLRASFRHLSVVDLDTLDEPRFDVFLDSLLFHALPDLARTAYVSHVTALAAPKARLFILAYAEAQSDVPHGLEPSGASAWFEPRWNVEHAAPTKVETRRHASGAAGWLYTLKLQETGAGMRTTGRAMTTRGRRYLDQMIGHLATLPDQQAAAAVPGPSHHGRRSHRGAGHGHQEPGHSMPAVLEIRPSDDLAAMVVFDCGTCEIRVSPDSLTLEVSAADNLDVDRLRTMLTDRLETIGRRDALLVEWDSTKPPSPSGRRGTQ